MSLRAAAQNWTRQWIDPPGEQPRWGLPETLAVALWAVAVGFALWQHVPWADEIQAWLLAGEVNTRTLLLHTLRYEGTGGLWHLFLKLCHTLHLPFGAARAFAAALELAAMVLLLRSPLPRALRLVLPFTFFLFYQDAVISRSYCLLAVLAFIVAHWLRQRRLRPVALALVLGLMANLSVHGAILSIALTLAALWVWRGALLRRPAAIALLLCLWVPAVIAMAPANDIDFGAGNNLRRSFAEAEKKLGMHPAMPPRITTLPMYGLPPVQFPTHARHATKAFTTRAQRILATVTFPVSSSRLVALLLAVLLVAQALRTRRTAGAGPLRAAGLLPWLLMVLVFSSLVLAPRHAGTLLTALVVTAWLTWPAPTVEPKHRLLLTRATTLVFLAASAQSVRWTAETLLHEHRQPYAPGRMTAEYLQKEGAGPRDARNIAGFYYYSISPLLAFPQNIYFNQPPHRYWLWSIGTGQRMTAEQVLAQHPRLIVVGGMDPGPESEVTTDWRPNDELPPGAEHDDLYRVTPFFLAHGYHIARFFCGHSWMRASYSEEICDIVLEPSHP